MKQKTEFRLGVGASSILMILVVLSLAALSLLSLHVAQSNAALTKRNLEMTLAYYQAAADVQHTLAAMDELIVQNSLAAENTASTDWLLRFQATQGVTVNPDRSFAFNVEAGAQRSIAVEGYLTPDAFPRYTLTRHELLPSEALLQQTPLTLFAP